MYMRKKFILLALIIMFINHSVALAIEPKHTSGVCFGLRPRAAGERENGNGIGDALYRDSIQLFARGHINEACVQMRQFLRQDSYYNGIELEFTDEDIEDIIESQVMQADVLSAGCFIQHYIYLITPPSLWSRKKLDDHLKSRYGVGLNGLITFDEATLQRKGIREKLDEDLHMWGCRAPRVLGGGLPVITSRILRQIAGQTIIESKGGPVTVQAFGKLGIDDEGSAVRRELGEGLGIDTSGLKTAEGSPTAISIVLSFGDFGRTFIKLQPQNANFEFSQEDIPDKAIMDADVIHVGGPTLTPEFLKGLPGFLVRAKHVPRDGRFKSGIKIVVDTTTDQAMGWNRVFEENPQAYEYIDALSVSFDEAVRITGTSDIDGILDFFINRGVKAVVLKRGEIGSYVAYAGEHGQETARFHIPALNGLKTGAPLWDETGAGDAYTTGLIYGIIHGWDIRKTTLFATVLGGMSCRYAGGTIENEGIIHAIYNMCKLRKQIAGENGHEAKVDLISSQGV